ncbi:MAG: GIY-YIG nuclease family protein [Verrucomicrobiia bacterium]
MKREQILEEIKRTAKANGGVPLGTQRFFAETGIKQSDWHGKYWVRWGDAVREAGFMPNQYNEAYDAEWIIAKLIALTRELGRFPVSGDLRMKARSDKDFPSHSVFGSLGSKSQLVSKVAEYCRTHEGFDDVLPLCKAGPNADELQPEEDSGETEEIGFVYLIKSGRHYKIGSSNASGRREYELAIQLPEKANLVHQIRTDDPVGIEAYWHKRFESQWKNGEWFELSASDIKAFKRRKFM